ncbi:MAG TPA: hypothetical protein VKU38_06330 [Ktedonobacteraceae bacterium]|nr:hypothetical protein [Ktedonobacteraceae bacterium]
MPISRRVLVLSIVVLLAVLILAAVVGYFTVMHTQAAPGSGQPVPAGYSIGQVGQVGHVSVKLNTAGLPLVAKPTDDNCMAVPSWDLTQRGLEGKGSDLLQLYFKLESKDVS